MTQPGISRPRHSTTAPPATAPPAPDPAAPTRGTGAERPRSTRVRALMRVVAIASCVPYLSLKAAWIGGSRIGIPDGSVLLDNRTVMIVANGVTVLMDACVIVLALLLTQAWGRRTPAWLLTLPLWCATGLLAPIMAGYPLQLLVQAFGGSVAISSDSSREPFLDPWVFTVVYTGFIVQGVALGTLFLLYARDRWGHLWRGRVRDLPGTSPTRPAQQAAAVAAALLAVPSGLMHLLWACGVTAGLGEARTEERTSGFYALEAVYVLFAVLTVAGVLMVAFHRGRALPLKAPLAMAWLGSSALACWGGWMFTASAVGDDPANNPTQLMNLTYSVQMIAGMLVVTIGAYFFAERAAAARPKP
ncbi:hypothetical protein [Streptomyces sp. SYSU K217416]